MEVAVVWNGVIDGIMVIWDMFVEDSLSEVPILVSE